MSDWRARLQGHVVRRVLIVKAGPLIYLHETLIVVRREFPHAQITVLTEERESDQVAAESDVDRVILYVNLQRRGGMSLEVREVNPDLVVVQHTGDHSYDKMKVLAFALSRSSPGLVLDDSMRVVSAGTWSDRLPSLLLEVLGRSPGPILRRAGTIAAWTVVWTARAVAFPAILLHLLLGVLRHEMTRRGAATRSRDP